MTRLLVLAFSIALCNPLSAAFGWKRTLTVDHTQVGSTDQSNFPVLVSFTNTALKTVANGGHVTNSSGFDIVFYADAGFVTKLDHEIERYVATTGETIMWVRIPSISHTVDTVFYMGYGNSSITTSQENKTGVWDSNFKMVQHLPDGTTLTANDSTANAVSGTPTAVSGHTPIAGTGIVDGAGSFSGNGEYIDYGLPSALQLTGNVTLSIWIKPTVLTSNARIFGKQVTTNAPPYTDYMLLMTGTGITFSGSQGGSFHQSNTATLSTGSWQYVTATYDGSTVTVYVNGVSQVTQTLSGALANSSGNVVMGSDPTNAAETLTGVLDEGRISNSVRSADWISTEYNNQKPSSTFLALGSEAAIAAINPAMINNPVIL